MALDPQTLARLNAADFVALVKQTSDGEIRDDLGGPHRMALLDAIFDRFPRQFRPENTAGRSARIDFSITGGPNASSDTYAVAVAEGVCVVTKDLAGEPDLSLTMGPSEFLKIITGTGNPAMMFMMGKVKARGDLSLAVGLASWFEPPGR